ncbi:hypothetical protein Pint_29924 [Pistacia integerrima]|uniref:Uncharacterized protein n=1 Tax=Pistacia integerrima TaxID=434235 RepID=A0ACC0WZZ7_9ROSI|nr:hypothetical protein Pint_29924 [Pistacia integerrima]
MVIGGKVVGDKEVAAAVTEVDQRSAGILTDGFGSTIEMTEKDLIWVVCWSHMEVDHYPSCLYAMMNKKTRKFANASEEILGGMKPIMLRYCDPLVNRDSRKLLQLDADKADYIRSGLNPGWTDMDVNQHVSHIKLVNYILEGVPNSIVKSYEL